MTFQLKLVPNLVAYVEPSIKPSFTCWAIPTLVRRASLHRSSGKSIKSSIKFKCSNFGLLWIRTSTRVRYRLSVLGLMSQLSACNRLTIRRGPLSPWRIKMMTFSKTNPKSLRLLRLSSFTWMSSMKLQYLFSPLRAKAFNGSLFKSGTFLLSNKWIAVKETWILI